MLLLLLLLVIIDSKSGSEDFRDSATRHVTSTQEPELTSTASATTTEERPNAAPRKRYHQPIPCTLVSYGKMFNCNSSNIKAPSADTTGPELLFDGDNGTCLQPLDGQDTLQIMFDTDNTESSPNLTVSITGERLDCDKPGMMVFKSMSCEKMNTKFAECALSKSAKMECRYKCDIISPCDGPARVALQMIRASWLPNNSNMLRLCEIRAYIIVISQSTHSSDNVNG